MKKILFLLTMVLSLTAIQSQAASLSWVSKPGNGFTNDFNDEEIFGDYGNGVPKGSLGTDNWVFNIDDSEKIEVNVIEFLDRELNLKVSLDGNLLDFVAPQWNFLGLVSAGNHTLTITGNALSKAEIDIRVAGIENVPVPAAVWLFGSAIMGLMGFTKRRKLAA